MKYITVNTVTTQPDFVLIIYTGTLNTANNIVNIIGQYI